MNLGAKMLVYAVFWSRPEVRLTIIWRGNRWVKATVSGA